MTRWIGRIRCLDRPQAQDIELILLPVSLLARNQTVETQIRDANAFNDHFESRVSRVLVRDLPGVSAHVHLNFISDLYHYVFEKVSRRQFTGGAVLHPL